ncbi:hypothetical protein BJP62_10525 [Jeongeupia sp. USM3]|nr:hypothetical protein BJP62_10525 [Jeongeupia sp. USM3]
MMFFDLLSTMLATLHCKALLLGKRLAIALTILFYILTEFCQMWQSCFLHKKTLPFFGTHQIMVKICNKQIVLCVVMETQLAAV